MDKLLFELRRIDAPIDYKAVLTPTNAGWTIPRLLMEMHSKKAAYTGRTFKGTVAISISRFALVSNITRIRYLKVPDKHTEANSERKIRYF